MTREEIIVQLAASLLANSYSQEMHEHNSILDYPIFIAKQAVRCADAILAETQSRSKENDKAFCVKAEAFVNFLNVSNYQTFWNGDELFYYCSCSDNPTRDVPASEVLSLFEDWQNR